VPISNQPAAPDTPARSSAAPASDQPRSTEKEARSSTATKANQAVAAKSPIPVAAIPIHRESRAEIINDSLSDKNQETDVWWGSYAGRTMTPSFVVCGLLTGLLIWGVWLIWPKQEDRPYLERYTTYILVGAVWIFQLIRWGYRLVAINYRLTTRRLYCQRGFQTAATTTVDLKQIATIRIERNVWESYLRVGRLRIVSVNNSEDALSLDGVAHPDQIAALIMNQVQKARAGG
jgi:hypothetical protein